MLENKTAFWLHSLQRHCQQYLYGLRCTVSDSEFSQSIRRCAAEIGFLFFVEASQLRIIDGEYISRVKYPVINKR